MLCLALRLTFLSASPCFIPASSVSTRALKCSPEAAVPPAEGLREPTEGQASASSSCCEDTPGHHVKMPGAHPSTSGCCLDMLLWDGCSGDFAIMHCLQGSPPALFNAEMQSLLKTLSQRSKKFIFPLLLSWGIDTNISSQATREQKMEKTDLLLGLPLLSSWFSP